MKSKKILIEIPGKLLPALRKQAKTAGRSVTAQTRQIVVDRLVNSEAKVTK